MRHLNHETLLPRKHPNINPVRWDTYMFEEEKTERWILLLFRRGLVGRDDDARMIGAGKKLLVTKLESLH